ncbi:hypothetical protein ACVDG3_08225 [Meridianimarinicoccus sp. RP-17]|uniref:hypothetical protein n=1 Tax=Meridianimarinicoccus zhengii TaxID=2056810 RepID=UPI000DAC1F25|nr:hypothetical protein [Phycocomes zhengii]
MTRLITAIAALVGVTAGASASAASFNGTFWDAPANSLATISDAISFATSNAADASFSATTINYGNDGTFLIGSLADFLNADAGSIVGDGSVNFQESVLRLTGYSFLTTGDEITVTSDDGFLLNIGGAEFSRFEALRGPTGTTSTIFTGPTGRYAVEMWYFEGNPTQARLETNLAPAPVPLPAGGLLLLTALAGGGALARCRKTA